MTVHLTDIHIGEGPAYIQGDRNRFFRGMDDLLNELGCEIEDHRVEVTEASGCRVPHPKFNVEFPRGSKVIKRPKEFSTSRTARGRRRKNRPEEPKKRWSMNDRKGQVLVPGIDSDYIVTYYKATDLTPALFDRGVHEVEKD